MMSALPNGSVAGVHAVARVPPNGGLNLNARRYYLLLQGLALCLLRPLTFLLGSLIRCLLIVPTILNTGLIPSRDTLRNLTPLVP